MTNEKKHKRDSATENEVRSTPTPWRLSTFNPAEIRTDDFPGPATTIAKAIGTGSFTQDEANAEFIVRAVNAYDELVTKTATQQDKIDRLEREVARLAAALAKAERG